MSNETNYNDIVGDSLKLGATKILPADLLRLLSAIAGVGAGYKVARGMATTASASDDINTGLASVVAAVAVLEDAPSLATLWVQAVVGNQAGAPAAGHILLKSWKPTAANDVTPLAATAFAKKVSWIAIGV